jgi:hypothetical protein
VSAGLTYIRRCEAYNAMQCEGHAPSQYTVAISQTFGGKTQWCTPRYFCRPCHLLIYGFETSATRLPPIQSLKICRNLLGRGVMSGLSTTHPSKIPISDLEGSTIAVGVRRIERKTIMLKSVRELTRRR